MRQGREIADHVGRVMNIVEGRSRPAQTDPAYERLARSWRRSLNKHSIDPGLSSVPKVVTAYELREHRERLAFYLQERTRQAIASNPDLTRITHRLPIVGTTLERELQTIVAGLLVQITDDLLTDLGEPGNEAVADVAAGLFDTFTRTHPEMGDALSGILLDSLELVKAQVSVQHWKRSEADETTRE